MGRWFDPDESDPTQWRGRGPYDDLRRGEDMLSVLQRATKTSLPYQYEVDVHHTNDVAEQFRTRAYSNARVVYNCGVDVKHRIKLLTRGLLWGNAEPHQRFQAQYRRSAPPSDSVPLGTYTVWMRYQYGTIQRTEDGVTFVAADEDAEETLRALDWDDLYDPVKERLAELELVRNPPFARYRLEERDEWEAYRTRFRYDPDAFSLGP